MTGTTTAPSGQGQRPRSRRRWRTVDIVVTSVIAVACGVVFWAWSFLSAVIPANPASGAIVGVWMLPAVLAPLVVRKPGAAVYAELVGGIVEALLGNQWGISDVWYGLAQGIGAEIVFGVFAYRRWGRVPAMLAGALAALAGGALDVTLYYAFWSPGWKAGYLALEAISGAVLAGLVSVALVRSLARTGVLAPFPSGRDAGS